jgi:hypothetical protein
VGVGWVLKRSRINGRGIDKTSIKIKTSRKYRRLGIQIQIRPA